MGSQGPGYDPSLTVGLIGPIMQSNILTESAVWPRMERSLLSRRTSPLVRRRFDPQQTDNSPDLHQILCSTGLGIVLLDLDIPSLTVKRVSD